jgi:hypothetical protein
MLSETQLTDTMTEEEKNQQFAVAMFLGLKAISAANDILATFVPMMSHKWKLAFQNLFSATDRCSNLFERLEREEHIERAYDAGGTWAMIMQGTIAMSSEQQEEVLAKINEIRDREIQEAS